MKLKNLVAVISGASQGLGYEIAKEFINQGANVCICSRDANQLNKAKDKLIALTSDKEKVLAKVTDVSIESQVQELIVTAYDYFGKIDILVANAGIYGAMGSIETVNWNDWVEAIEINLKGTVLQCRTLLPYFKKQRSGKIIISAGGGATKPMPNFSAYAASKAGIVRFAETLAEEVKEFNIDVNAIAPGPLNTKMLDEAIAAGPDKIGDSYYRQMLKQKQEGGVSLSIAASLCTFLASNESNGISGKLISAIWDPWKNLSNYKKELIESDIYTLRRITPEDRCKNWLNEETI